MIGIPVLTWRHQNSQSSQADYCDHQWPVVVMVAVPVLVLIDVTPPTPYICEVLMLLVPVNGAKIMLSQVGVLCEFFQEDFGFTCNLNVPLNRIPSRIQELQRSLVLCVVGSENKHISH